MSQTRFTYCYRTFFVVFLFLIQALSIKANGINRDVLPPELTCVSVVGESSIQLNWNLPANVNSNYSYLIYFSYSPNGPYIKADSVQYNQTSYTHSGVLPYAGQLFYYLRSCSLTVGKRSIYSAPSDTLKTMMLSFTDFGNGIINLSWNALASNNINGSGNWYYIYMEFPAGKWTKRDSLPVNTAGLSINDTIDICGAFLNFKIVLPNSNGCNSFSTVKGKFLTDKTIPYPPVIEYVTVDTTINHNVIKWQPDKSSDTKGYYIYKYINPTGTKIDSVLGRFNTTYIHTGSNPQIDKETYYIIAFDSCELASAGSSVHNSMFLAITPNQCEYNIKLFWNPYINMETGLAAYLIYRKTNNGSYSLICTNPSDKTDYVDYQIRADSVYTYYVKAIDNSGLRSSNSNNQTLKFLYPRKPDFNYLRKVTVLSSNQIEASFHIDTTNYISEYHLYKIVNNLDTVFVKNLFHQNVTEISIIDNSVNTNTASYQYIMKLRDICNDENLLNSNISNSICVKGHMQNGMKNYLKWNKYESWAGNVNHYDVYRRTESGWETYPVATILPDGNDTLTFTDDVSGFDASNGQFSYYIEAVEGNGNIFGFKDTSRSNITNVNQYPKLFVPNAFAPGGINSKFMPVMGFVYPESYLMQIYDRWGAKIFETTDRYQGWDGTINNNDAPQGVYLYLIKVKNSNNENIEKRGTVTLIR
jgi:gliding motility-associated-like protein